jgi:hypothetical protein
MYNPFKVKELPVPSYKEFMEMTEIEYAASMNTYREDYWNRNAWERLVLDVRGWLRHIRCAAGTPTLTVLPHLPEALRAYVMRTLAAEHFWILGPDLWIGYALRALRLEIASWITSKAFDVSLVFCSCVW